MKNITILNFSTRNLGNCAKIAAHIQLFHAADQVQSFIMDSRISPCGGCDYACLDPKAKCPRVDIFQETVMQSVLRSDLTYMIIPNYCGFPCATYLAFNERSVGFFNMDRTVIEQYMTRKKRFIIISNTENEIFEQAMRQQTVGEPDVLYLKSSKYGKRSTAGDILESDAARTDLEAFLNAAMK